MNNCNKENLEMEGHYFSYHSNNPNQTIERIKHDKSITEVDDITRGVEILRKVRARRGD